MISIVVRLRENDDLVTQTNLDAGRAARPERAVRTRPARCAPESLEERRSHAAQLT